MASQATVSKTGKAAKSTAASPKIALVTGAASGIGKATAKGLAGRGYHVVLLVRNEARGSETQKALKSAIPSASSEVLVCDLSLQSSVRAAAKEFLRRHDTLDVLVNCAGVFLPEKTMTPDGIEATFATNHLGHFLLTNELLPALRKAAPARIVNVASRYGGTKIDFDDIDFTTRKFSYLKAVPQSKLAQVLFTQELAARLDGSGVTVNAVHPGLVANTKLLTKTGGPFRFITNLMGGKPEKGADTVVWLATEPSVAGESGKLWASRKPMKTPGQGSDPAARTRLWEESEKRIRPAK